MRGRAEDRRGPAGDRKVDTVPRLRLPEASGQEEYGAGKGRRVNKSLAMDQKTVAVAY